MKRSTRDSHRQKGDEDRERGSEREVREGDGDREMKTVRDRHRRDTEAHTQSEIWEMRK